ncbi:hypothetical protein ACFQY0_14600 [Haloferula chungangensis]|uniref:Cytochrome C n=1 Tax=Haloferula chungangensis TaxID=1048331 RepID=A0ABW2LC96_9BACT
MRPIGVLFLVVGDWVFSARKLGGNKAEGKPEELTKCATCHEDYEDTGFVSEKTVDLLSSFVNGGGLSD